jgi:tetratricopeptide (TPR) repeat protein
MMIKDLLGFAACLLLFVLAGCGGQVAPASVASGEAEFEQGKTMAISGDHAGALAKLDNAIKSGVLGPDLHSEALLYRAQCLAVTGKVDEANADIENATMGGPSEALLEFTKGVVLDKQGKESESKAAFAKAAKLDPSFKNRK